MVQTLRLLEEMHEGTGSALEAADILTVKQAIITVVSHIDPSIFVQPTIETYVRLVNSGDYVDSRMADELRNAADSIDEEYFRLQQVDKVPEKVWDFKFRQARMAAALAMMANGITQSNYADIVYELAHSGTDPLEVLRLVEKELSKAH
jgi:hypothetical protein